MIYGEYVLINQYIGFDDEKITIPLSINGKPVIGIWNNVFEKCLKLEEVVFEEGCQYIGKEVFADCINLKKVKLPKSLLEIGDSAFIGCKNLIEIGIPPQVNVIGTFAFSYCKKLSKVILPDQLVCISNDMLADTAIEEIVIPQSIMHIGYSAFANTKLTEVTLPCNLYSIEENAFAIPTLRKITIPSNTQVMEENCLLHYSSLVIYCAAGSKAQLYARKYGMECSPIPASKESDVEIGSNGIIIELGSKKKTDSLLNWYKGLGIHKQQHGYGISQGC